jgi:hypothetical protein
MIMLCSCKVSVLGGKITPRVLQPSPLKKNLVPEIQGERFLRAEKPVIQIPISAKALSYQTSSIREANLIRDTF